MRSSKRFSFSAECTFVFEDVVDKNDCCYGINYLEPGLTFGFVSSLQEYYGLEMYEMQICESDAIQKWYATRKWAVIITLVSQLKVSL